MCHQRGYKSNVKGRNSITEQPFLYVRNPQIAKSTDWSGNPEIFIPVSSDTYGAKDL